MRVKSRKKRSSNPRITKKERNLLKGAIRRVFSRSELRQKVLDAALIVGHFDPKRPRVTKWARCNVCKSPAPRYLTVIDHIDPLVPIDRSFEEMSLDEAVDRTWCAENNLQPICPDCHKSKSALENKQRRLHKKSRAP